MTSSRKKETLITSELEELLTCGLLQTSSFLKDFHRGNKETEFGDTFFDPSSPLIKCLTSFLMISICVLYLNFKNPGRTGTISLA